MKEHVIAVSSESMPLGEAPYRVSLDSPPEYWEGAKRYSTREALVSDLEFCQISEKGINNVLTLLRNSSPIRSSFPLTEEAIKLLRTTDITT